MPEMKYHACVIVSCRRDLALTELAVLTQARGSKIIENMLNIILER